MYGSEKLPRAEPCADLWNDEDEEEAEKPVPIIDPEDFDPGLEDLMREARRRNLRFVK